MRLLLDTHIWVWSLLDPAKLSRRVRTEVESPDKELWLSPISTLVTSDERLLGSRRIATLANR